MDLNSILQAEDIVVLFSLSLALPLETKEIVLPRPHRLHHIVEDFLTLW